MAQYDYLIVGAGLYGAVFAHEAKAAGKRVLVIDKRPNIGGNVYTEPVEGIQVHVYGAHIFHTNNKEVWDYVNRFSAFNRFTNSPVANYRGELYSLPFKESFAGGTISTQLWQAIPMVQGATSCGLDNPNGSYNQCTAAQDNDGGCVYFYNGYQYETPAGALLVTPKVKLSTSTGNELHFWAYHFKEVYSSPAFIQVAISENDSQFANISNAQFEIGESTEAGWKEHVVNLDRYRNADFVSVALMGITNGYQDVIYADNISIINTSDTGVNDVRSTGSTAAQDCFDLQGRKVNPAKYHGVVVRNGKKMVLR